MRPRPPQLSLAERTYRRIGGLVGVATELILRNRGLPATISILNVNQLSRRYIDQAHCRSHEIASALQLLPESPARPGQIHVASSSPSVNSSTPTVVTKPISDTDRPRTEPTNKTRRLIASEHDRGRRTGRRLDRPTRDPLAVARSAASMAPHRPAAGRGAAAATSMPSTQPAPASTAPPWRPCTRRLPVALLPARCPARADHIGHHSFPARPHRSTSSSRADATLPTSTGVGFRGPGPTAVAFGPAGPWSGWPTGSITGATNG